MSSVLFLSDNAQLRSRVEAVLASSGFDVTSDGAAEFQQSDRSFDCAVVDSGSRSPELVALLQGKGNRCIISIYGAEDEHVMQLSRGALWGIPAITDVADQLKDGPKSVDMAIGTAMLRRPSGDPARDRFRVGLSELLIGFKNPKE